MYIEKIENILGSCENIKKLMKVTEGNENENEPFEIGEIHKQILPRKKGLESPKRFIKKNTPLTIKHPRLFKSSLARRHGSFLSNSSMRVGAVALLNLRNQEVVINNDPTLRKIERNIDFSEKKHKPLPKKEFKPQIFDLKGNYHKWQVPYYFKKRGKSNHSIQLRAESRN